MCCLPGVRQLAVGVTSPWGIVLDGDEAGVPEPFGCSVPRNGFGG